MRELRSGHRGVWNRRAPLNTLTLFPRQRVSLGVAGFSEIRKEGRREMARLRSFAATTLSHHLATGSFDKQLRLRYSSAKVSGRRKYSVRTLSACANLISMSDEGMIIPSSYLLISALETPTHLPSSRSDNPNALRARYNLVLSISLAACTGTA